MLRLVLCPVLNDTLLPHLPFYPSTRLEFSRDYRIFCQITGFPDRLDSGEQVAPTIPVRHLPHTVSLAESTDEGFYYASTTSRSGHPLTCTTAGELSQLTVSPDSEPPNHAIMAFLRALPASTVVILIWE